MGSNLSSSKKQNLIFAVTAAVIFVVQIFKAQRGFGSPDEHFYITLGYRLYQGDAMFFDDWHIAQMISVFLYPLVSLFIRVTGGTDGIVLYMRIMYALFTCLTGTALYIRFRKYGLYAAAASAVYMLFTPFSIMALSYNTMSVGFLILSAMLWPDDQERTLQMIFSGILFAWAVLNTPYLAVVYAALTVVMLVRKDLFSLKSWLCLTCGCAAAAVVFIGFAVSRASLTQILSGLPHLIDPSHSDSVFLLIAKNGARLAMVFTVFIVGFAAEIILAFKGRSASAEAQRKIMIMAEAVTAAAMVYVCFIVPYRSDSGGLSVITIPFAVYGLLFMLWRESDKRITACYILSVVHAFLIAVSSNVGPASFSCPLIFACAMTVLALRNDRGEYKKIHWSALLFAVLLVFIKTAKGYDAPDNYRIRASGGPLAGLCDTEEHEADYLKSLSDVRMISQLDGDEAMLVTWNSWMYLALDKRIATNSTYIYFWQEEEYIEAQKDYVLQHPDKLPMYVYLDTSNAPYEMTDENAWFSSMTKLQTLDNGILYLREE